MDIKEISLDFLRCFPNIQKFINRRYKYDGETFIINPEEFPVVTSKEGVRYHITPLSVLHNDYRLDGIREKDVVLDIGANAGAFALRAAKIADRIFAIEPLMYAELIQNINLNSGLIKQVTPLKLALGNGEIQSVEWFNKSLIIRSTTFNAIRDICGGNIDVLKCDAEGFEWFIKPEELLGIREIHMELHYGKNLPIKYNPVLMKYIQENYHATITNGDTRDSKILYAVKD